MTTERPSFEYSKLDSDLVLTTDQVAEWLKVSASTLNKARMEGKGPKYIKMGRSVRYRVQNIRDWIDFNMRERVRFSFSLDSKEFCSDDILEWLRK